MDDMMAAIIVDVVDVDGSVWAIKGLCYIGNYLCEGCVLVT